MFYVLSARTMDRTLDIYGKDVSPSRYTLRHSEWFFPQISMARAFAQKSALSSMQRLYIYEGNEDSAEYRGSVYREYRYNLKGAFVYATKTKMYRLKKDGTLGNAVKR